MHEMHLGLAHLTTCTLRSLFSGFSKPYSFVLLVYTYFNKSIKLMSAQDLKIQNKTMIFTCHFENINIAF